jgi:hypothetical protein
MGFLRESFGGREGTLWVGSSEDDASLGDKERCDRLEKGGLRHLEKEDCELAWRKEDRGASRDRA